MTKKLYSLALLVMAVLIATTGCASVSATSHAEGGQRQSPRARVLSRQYGELSEREKWSLAREAYSQALHEQQKKDTEAASEFYEATLELLGSLDLASVELPTQRVLEFQRKVLGSYDKFLASVETLPPSAGSAVVLEAIPRPEIPEEDNELTESHFPSKPDPKGDVPSPAPAFVRDPLPPVPMTRNSLVNGQVNFFMNKGRKVMLRWMERSARIFPRLRPILAEEGVPDDVLYLAMIESGLNPEAYSYAHAAGIWQFIPSTGRIYGLRIEPTYDERLNIESATRSACRYLRKLHDEFGDWYLAFAAYNCGEGRVAKEVRRSRTQNYWGLNRLPRQTRNYVPAYLATRTICENPEQYGFPPLPPEVPFECKRIWVDECLNLEDVARAAGVDHYAVRELNPEFRRGTTPGRGSVMVRLPNTAHDDFEVRLASLPKRAIDPTTIHRVRKGETLKAIAGRYGVRTSDITSMAENRSVKWKKLKIGQEIVVPVPTATASTAEQMDGRQESAAHVQQASAPRESHEIVYTVHRGETLGRIARQLGVSVDEICRQNRIKNPNQIEPGQKLVVKVDGGAVTEPTKQVASKTAPAKTKQTYRVRAGDTVWSIARAHGTNTDSILRWNSLKKSSRIYPGQRLVVGWQ